MIRTINGTLGVLTAIIMVICAMVIALEIPLRLGGYLGLRERWCIHSCIEHGGGWMPCVDNCQAFYMHINEVTPK